MIRTEWPLWALYPTLLLVASLFFACIVWAEPMFRLGARDRMSSLRDWGWRPEEMERRLRLLAEDPEAFTRRYLWWGVLFLRVIASLALVLTAVLLWGLLLATFDPNNLQPRPDMGPRWRFPTPSNHYIDVGPRPVLAHQVMGLPKGRSPA